MKKSSVMEPLPPLGDMVFAKMFENKEAARAARGLINAVLRDAGYPQVKEIIEVKSQYTLLGDLIEEAKSQGGTGFSHGGRVDVRALDENDALFEIEVQLYWEPLIVDRSLFYDGLMVRDAFSEGGGYEQLPRRVIINLLGKGVRRAPDEYHNVIGLTYLNGSKCELASERIRIHNIELDAFERLYGSTPTEGLSELGVWLRYMLSGYRDRKEERKMIDNTKELEEFAKRYHFAADDPQLREKYEFIMSGVRDEATRMNRAKQEGREEVLEEVAARMKAAGMSSAEITKLTGLTDKGSAHI